MEIQTDGFAAKVSRLMQEASITARVKIDADLGVMRLS